MKLHNMLVELSNMGAGFYFFTVGAISAIMWTAFTGCKKADSREGAGAVVADDYAKEYRSFVDEQIKAARTWDDKKFAIYLNDFLFDTTDSNWAQGSKDVLTGVGPRTQQAVMKILKNSSLRQKLVIPNNNELLKESPLERACMVLGDSPSADFVDALRPFLQDEQQYIRKVAAYTIGKTGADTAAPIIIDLLKGSDGEVAARILSGLEFPFSRNGISPKLGRDIFPSLLLAIPKHSDAAKLAYKLDPEEVTTHLLKTENFNLQSKVLSAAIEVFNDNYTSVPREKLLTLLSQLDAKQLTRTDAWLMRDVLAVLGQQRDERDRPLLESRIRHPNEYVADGAGEGLLRLHGLSKFYEAVFKKRSERGYATLSLPERYYLSVVLCDAEICNGGFSQYFLNSYSNYWPDALAGYKAIGSIEKYELLKIAVEKFGPDGPSTDSAQRDEQRIVMYRKDSTLFKDLDTRYYKSNEALWALISLYVIDNRQFFTD